MRFTVIDVPKALTLDKWNRFLSKAFRWGDTDKTILIGQEGLSSVYEMLDEYLYRAGLLWNGHKKSLVTAFGTLTFRTVPKMRSIGIVVG